MRKMNSSGVRDTSWWRRASFFDICRSKFDSGCRGEAENLKLINSLEMTLQKERFRSFWSLMRLCHRILVFHQWSDLTLLRHTLLLPWPVILTQRKLFKRVSQVLIQSRQMSLKSVRQYPVRAEPFRRIVWESWKFYIFLPFKIFLVFAISISASAVLNVWISNLWSE